MSRLVENLTAFLAGLFLAVWVIEAVARSCPA